MCIHSETRLLLYRLCLCVHVCDQETEAIMYMYISSTPTQLAVIMPGMNVCEEMTLAVTTPYSNGFLLASPAYY